jgi:asparagine synthase (glutamine-hydrolysing)
MCSDVALQAVVGVGVAGRMPLDPRAPHAAAWRSVAVAFDGRIDNRADIAARFHISNVAAGDDTALVTRLYERAGIAFVESLVGDFAFTLLDAGRRAVFLVRDFAGTRPLFFAEHRGHLVWHSDLSALAREIAASVELTDEYLAGYLSTHARDCTPYRGIRPVPPGAIVSVVDGRITTRSYWRPVETDEYAGLGDAECEARFRELFRNAVAARMTGPHIVSAELSGGLDSSAIVCVASDLVQARSVDATTLQTVSYVYSDAPTSDETRFIRAVEEVAGTRAAMIDDRSIVTTLFERPAPAMPTPMWLFDDTFQSLRVVMQSAGSSVLLSGHGGNETSLDAGLPNPVLTDLFVDGEWRKLARWLHALSTHGRLSYAHIVWTSIAWPLLPAWIRRRRPPHAEAGTPAWFSRDGVMRWGLSERTSGFGEGSVYDSFVKRRRYQLLLGATALTAAGYYRERAGVDATYPFLDRRLVDFLFNVDGEQMIRPHETRSLQRRAFTPILPPAVGRRQVSRGPYEALCRALNREWPRVRAIAAASRVGALGIVDQKGFGEALQRARLGMPNEVGELARMLCLEMWLRAQDPETERR